MNINKPEPLDTIRIAIPGKGRSSKIFNVVSEEFLKRAKAKYGLSSIKIEFVPIRPAVMLRFFADENSLRKTTPVANVIDNVRQKDDYSIDAAVIPYDVLSEARALDRQNGSNLSARVRMVDGTETSIGKCRMVFMGKPGFDPADVRTVVTSNPGLTREYLEKRFSQDALPEIVYFEGGCERLVAEGGADAAFDIVETGSTMKKFGLIEYAQAGASQFAFFQANDPLSPRSKLVESLCIEFAECCRERVRPRSFSPLEAAQMANQVSGEVASVTDRLTSNDAGSRTVGIVQSKRIFGMMIEEAEEVRQELLADNSGKSVAQEIADFMYAAEIVTVYADSLTDNKYQFASQLGDPKLWSASFSRNGVDFIDRMATNASDVSQNLSRLRACAQREAKLEEGQSLPLEVIRDKQVAASDMQKAIEETVMVTMGVCVEAGIDLSSVASVLSERSGNPLINRARGSFEAVDGREL